MNIFITGIGGALGSLLTPALITRGYNVKGNDIKSPEEVHTVGFFDFTYLWKATEDLTRDDLCGTDIIINLSATADRPLGGSSSVHTVYNNVIPTVKLLELAKVRSWKISLKSAQALEKIGKANPAVMREFADEIIADYENGLFLDKDARVTVIIALRWAFPDIDSLKSTEDIIEEIKSRL